MKKFSVVLGVRVNLDRTVVVEARTAKAAEKEALKRFGQPGEALVRQNVSDWETTGQDGDVLVVVCDEADDDELETEA